jgi:hypothetical protein
LKNVWQGMGAAESAGWAAKLKLREMRQRELPGHFSLRREKWVG